MTESQPIFKTPGYAEKRAAQREFLVETQSQVVGEASDENRVLPVLMQGRGLPEAKPYVEKPWHRHAAHYFAMGYPVKEIAKECGVEVGAIYTLIRRPEFQSNVNSIIETHGFGDIMVQFKNEVAASLATIVEIRDDEKAPKAVRRQCAMDIIDRVLGKATQKIEHTQGAGGDPVKEFARLENQNEQLRSQLN